MFETFPVGSVFQGATFVTVILALVGALGYWIKGLPERGRVKNEASILTAKIEEDMRGEAAVRFREFREEVHALRNELQRVEGKLHTSMVESVRRSDKLNMVLFILRMVMDELHVKDPESRILDQARTLLGRLENEPHQKDNSAALNAAEDTVDAANSAVREVKAVEAKGPKDD